MTNSSTYPFKHLPEKKEFQLLVGDQIARVNYREEKEGYVLVYSEVPYQLRGRGVGEILVTKTFEYLEEQEIKSRATCGYIAYIAQKHEKWRDKIG